MPLIACGAPLLQVSSYRLHSFGHLVLWISLRSTPDLLHRWNSHVDWLDIQHPDWLDAGNPMLELNLSQHQGHLDACDSENYTDSRTCTVLIHKPTAGTRELTTFTIDSAVNGTQHHM